MFDELHEGVGARAPPHGLAGWQGRLAGRQAGRQAGFFFISEKSFSRHFGRPRGGAIFLRALRARGNFFLLARKARKSPTSSFGPR